MVEAIEVREDRDKGATWTGVSRRAAGAGGVGGPGVSKSPFLFRFLRVPPKSIA